MYTHTHTPVPQEKTHRQYNAFDIHKNKQAYIYFWSVAYPLLDKLVYSQNTYIFLILDEHSTLKTQTTLPIVGWV